MKCASKTLQNLYTTWNKKLWNIQIHRFFNPMSMLTGEKKKQHKMKITTWVCLFQKHMQQILNYPIKSMYFKKLHIHRKNISSWINVLFLQSEFFLQRLKKQLFLVLWENNFLDIFFRITTLQSFKISGPIFELMAF